MPSRMIDYDALWTSAKLASCSGKTRLEYVWRYGLADANGSFEYDLRAIRSKVAAIRPRVTLRYLERVFSELTEHGLAFRWHENGKSYLHWTLSDVSGRLPALSARHRYKKFAPDVPKKELAEFESRYRQAGVVIGSRLGVGVELDRGLIGLDKGFEYRTPEACGFGAPGPAENSSQATKTETGNSTSPRKKAEHQNFDFACMKCGQGFATGTETSDHYQKCGRR